MDVCICKKWICEQFDYLVVATNKLMTVSWRVQASRVCVNVKMRQFKCQAVYEYT